MKVGPLVLMLNKGFGQLCMVWLVCVSEGSVRASAQMLVTLLETEVLSPESLPFQGQAQTWL